MAINLTNSEIELLKELHGAGDRGRLISKRWQPGFFRLVNARYVMEKTASRDVTAYFITLLGRHALNNAAA
jgi:hypothetical protein